ISVRMKKYVSSTRWLNVFFAAVILSALVYATNVAVAEVHPGNIWGLSYGTAAAVLFFGAALYGLRRRSMKFSARMNLGKAQTWVQFHLYGGVMFLLMTLMHTGFQLPHGALNWLLWGLSIWVTLSGLLGVLLQRWIAGALSSGLEIEVIYERIPELAGELNSRAEAIVANAPESLKRFYTRELAHKFKAPGRSLRFFIDISGGAHPMARSFEHLRRAVSGENAETALELESLYRAKLALDAHYSLQSALRAWMYLHLPISIALTL
ncbi:MAG: hypothetical protein ACE5GA_08420, partial [Candidatus Zixiibacteriota bacterium]